MKGHECPGLCAARVPCSCMPCSGPVGPTSPQASSRLWAVSHPAGRDACRPAVWPTCHTLHRLGSPASRPGRPGERALWAAKGHSPPGRLQASALSPDREVPAREAYAVGRLDLRRRLQAQSRRLARREAAGGGGRRREAPLRPLASSRAAARRRRGALGPPAIGTGATSSSLSEPGRALRPIRGRWLMPSWPESSRWP